MTDKRPELPESGPAAPPRDNGELAFDAPWQGRALALAVHLCENGHFEWREFQQALIREIGTWEAAHADGERYRYWDHWQAALERLVARKHSCSPEELNARAREISARPHGWDH